MAVATTSRIFFELRFKVETPPRLPPQVRTLFSYDTLNYPDIIQSSLLVTVSLIMTGFDRV